MTLLLLLKGHVTGGADANVTPATVDVVVSVDTPTVTAASNVTSTTVDVVASLDTPAATAAANVTTTNVDVVAFIDTPTPAANANVTSTTVDVPASLDTPTVAGNANVTTATVDVVVSLDTPLVDTGACTVEFTDNFNDDTLDAPWELRAGTSGEAVSGKFRASATSTVGRWIYDDPVGSDDHCVHATVRFTSVASQAEGQVLFRYDDTDDTGYEASIHHDQRVRFGKIITGTFTELADEPFTVSVDTNYLLEARIDGADTSIYVNGALVVGPITDSSVTTGTRTGIASFVASVGAVTLDDWASGELASGDADVSATNVDVVASVNTPTVTADGNVTTTTVDVAGSVNTPTVAGNANATPTTIDVAVSIDTPTVTTAADANVTPATVDVAVSIDTPTVAGNANVSATTVEVVGFPSGDGNNVYTAGDPDTTYGSGDWELGARIVVNTPCTLTGIRAYNQGTQNNTDRTYKLWDSVSGFASGTLNRSINAFGVVPAGWTEYQFSTPLEVTSVPDYFVISQDVLNNSDGLSKTGHDAITSPDGVVTLTNDGCLHATQNTFPNSTIADVYYGVDLLYVARPSVAGNAGATPSTVDVVVSVDTPAVDTGGGADANVTPTTVDVVASVDTPTVTGNAAHTTTTVAITVEIPTPTVTVQQNAAPTPATVELTVSINTPSVVAGTRADYVTSVTRIGEPVAATLAVGQTGAVSAVALLGFPVAADAGVEARVGGTSRPESPIESRIES